MGHGTTHAFDRAELVEQLGGDEDLAREVIGLFLQDCPVQMTAIAGALAARDPRGLHAAAHTLKGAAGTITAHRLAEAARLLETCGREARVEDATEAWRMLEAEADRVLAALRDEV
jgi:HPt (histidine-containing phosphotransfer) domain-containing protein